jgi:hypothetical protein
MLWILFGIKGGDITGEWRKLHNDERNDLYCSHDIVRVIKWKRLRWAGNVTRMGKRRVVRRVLMGKLKERDHFGDQA